MKNIISILLVLFFMACASKEGDKKAELEKLKTDQTALKEKIVALEEAIAKEDTTSANEKLKLIGITEMKTAPFSHYIEVQAKVEGDEDVMVSPEAMGNITAVLVNAGDVVSKGQTLATIDDKLMQRGIAELQSQLDLVLSLYNKQKNLWDQKIGTEVQYLSAKTNKESMERRMASMQEQLSMTRIKSPISGTVDDVNIKIGQSVMPGLPAIRVVNLNALKLKAEVPESYISKVKKGNEVLIYLPDLKKEIKGNLSYSAKVISTMNRTFNVEVKLNSKEVDFNPNMVATLKIIDYSNPNTFSLPLSVVLKGTEGEYVFVAAQENKKLIAKRRQIKQGIVYNGTIEIKEGLMAGDKVITSGFQNLVEGDEIKM